MALTNSSLICETYPASTPMAGLAGFSRAGQQETVGRLFVSMICHFSRMALDIRNRPRYIRIIDSGNKPTRKDATVTLKEIYAEYVPGSLGFCIAVETYCGFKTTRTETERIADLAATAEEFEAVWEEDDSWTDENNQ